MRKPGRRPIYYRAFALHDGTVTAAVPIRKPPKRERCHVDPEGVAIEYADSGRQFSDVNDENRTRFQDIISVNLNTRRAIRELVLPRVAELHAEIHALREQLERVEKSLMGSAAPAALGACSSAQR